MSRIPTIQQRVQPASLDMMEIWSGSTDWFGLRKRLHL